MIFVMNDNIISQYRNQLMLKKGYFSAMFGPVSADKFMSYTGPQIY